jgi:hypothetical protein
MLALLVGQETSVLRILQKLAAIGPRLRRSIKKKFVRAAERKAIRRIQAQMSAPRDVDFTDVVLDAANAWKYGKRLDG